MSTDKPSIFVIKNRFTHYLQAVVVVGVLWSGCLAFTHLEGLQTAASGLWSNWLNAKVIDDDSVPTSHKVTTIIFRSFWGIMLIPCFVRLLVIYDMSTYTRGDHGYKNEWTDYFVIPDLIRRIGITTWMIPISPIFITMDLYYTVFFGIGRIMSFKFYKKK